MNLWLQVYGKNSRNRSRFLSAAVFEIQRFPVGNSFPPAVVFFGGLGSISLEMESYSLALQLQAAQEVIGEEMPRRALIVKMLLFTKAGFFQLEFPLL